MGLLETAVSIAEETEQKETGIEAWNPLETGDDPRGCLVRYIYPKTGAHNTPKSCLVKDMDPNGEDDSGFVRF